MRKLILLCTILLVSVCAFSQTQHFYYYKGQKQYSTLDRSKLTVFAEADFDAGNLPATGFKTFSFKTDNSTAIQQLYTELEFTEMPSEVDYLSKINELRNIAKIVAVCPSYITADNAKVGMSNFFYIKLKQASDYETLVQNANSYNCVVVEQNKFMPLWYTLKTTKNTIPNTLEVANSLFETENFASCVSDFMGAAKLTCANDPIFSSQWGLKNNTTSGVDINVCPAWNVSQGLGTIIAIVDMGIEKHIQI